MSMLKFEETRLLREITQLPVPARVAFGAACAERLLPSYERFWRKTGEGDFAALSKMLCSLWDDLSGNTMSGKEIKNRIDASMQLIPEGGGDPWRDEQAAAEDAVAAVVYALRCRLDGQGLEAVWAARRAYEALDSYVTTLEDIDTNVPGEEERVLSSDLIQSELIRQERDLNQLQQGSITLEELRQRAIAEGRSFLPG